jgi:hypothetical protein
MRSDDNRQRLVRHGRLSAVDIGEVPLADFGRRNGEATLRWLQGRGLYPFGRSM